ncbi:bifunctional 4-hydroxy-2-oxoglutarate aldolase/2-dehydro-3-deoxy-phosphogluconate aldolase [Microbacterium sp. CIAB417]|uniref:bifunctional 4-hydroxy-2-oxoglutarate aldolase/2-dehydro-3-deoxy-phosphogluconate aldolase n=1 Tax=Microbacterium sp. CIAB417 TaxID=2860287 RepID=UPI001FACF097|nr:bifunctional 4-hydroxy-2-oxoglutarate aldolase/2-dehydro-3-deoxy-phosphogluconate aldolase [Microbacterium sp. CIAB417]
MLSEMDGVPVVAVLRAPDSSRFVDVAAALVAGGVRAIELTLTTRGAIRALRAVRSALPDDVRVGCGTVRTRQHVDAAIDAGADFLVSQIFNETLVVHAASAGIEYIPGALTPTEIVRAAEYGSPIVKVSPIGPFGGLDYLRELVGPLPDISLFVTGGVKPAEAGSYIRAGAALVGLSGLLLGDALSSHGDLTALIERTRAAIATVPSSINEGVRS